MKCYSHKEVCGVNSGQTEHETCWNPEFHVLSLVCI